MLVDLISSSNQGYYNISVAKLFGLSCAVYLDVLIRITEKAIRKNKVTDGYVILDRNYIERVTTLGIDEQLELDKRLIQTGIMQKNPIGEVSIDLMGLALTITEDEKSWNRDIESIMSKAHKSLKVSKEESMLEGLKSYVTTRNEFLRKLYYDWIDSVIQKEGWMSSVAVSEGEKAVDSFSNHNPKISENIINIAATNGYRDMNWAIERFKATSKERYNTNNQKIDYTNSRILKEF